MPEPKEKKQRKPRAPKAEAKPAGPLVLAFKAKFTPEDLETMTSDLQAITERIATERKQVSALKAALRRRATVSRVSVTAAFRADGALIITGPDGVEIPLSRLTPGQAALCCKAARR